MNCHIIPFSLHCGPRALRFFYVRAAVSRRKLLNPALNRPLTRINLCKYLISRECTPLHINGREKLAHHNQACSFAASLHFSCKYLIFSHFFAPVSRRTRLQTRSSLPHRVVGGEKRRDENSELPRHSELALRSGGRRGSRSGEEQGAKSKLKRGGGGRNWIRTSEGVSQEIYSLPPLATWVSYQPIKAERSTTRSEACQMLVGFASETENPAFRKDGINTPTCSRSHQRRYYAPEEIEGKRFCAERDWRQVCGAERRRSSGNGAACCQSRRALSPFRAELFKRLGFLVVAFEPHFSQELGGGAADEFSKGFFDAIAN